LWQAAGFLLTPALRRGQQRDRASRLADDEGRGHNPQQRLKLEMAQELAIRSLGG
jgi:hypothetical protein